MADETKKAEKKYKGKKYEKRLFKYENYSWEDPGEEYDIPAIQNHLSSIHPAIRQADVQQKVVSGVLEVTFVKKAKGKGGQ